MNISSSDKVFFKGSSLSVFGNSRERIRVKDMRSSFEDLSTNSDNLAGSGKKTHRLRLMSSSKSTDSTPVLCKIAYTKENEIKRVSFDPQLCSGATSTSGPLLGETIIRSASMLDLPHVARSKGERVKMCGLSLSASMEELDCPRALDKKRDSQKPSLEFSPSFNEKKSKLRRLHLPRLPSRSGKFTINALSTKSATSDVSRVKTGGSKAEKVADLLMTAKEKLERCKEQYEHTREMYDALMNSPSQGDLSNFINNIRIDLLEKNEALQQAKLDVMTFDLAILALERGLPLDALTTSKLNFSCDNDIS